MQFREWFLTEEIYFENNTATVFHRTKAPTNIKGIISSGYRPGKGCFHGCGLYTTYELSAQMRSNMIDYGRYIMKYKVANLNKYLVFELDKAKQIHKENWTLSSQITRLSPSLAKAIEKFKIKSLEDLNEWQQASKNGSDISQFLHENFQLDYFALLDKETFKGIIYYGQQDGPCLLKYNPINEGTDIILLAYAEAPFGANIESLQWIRSTSLTSLRTHSNYLKQMQGKKFMLAKDDPDFLSELLHFSSDPDLTARRIIFDKKDSLTVQTIADLLIYAENKQKIAKWIIKYKTNLSNANVYHLLHFTDDKQEIASLLGSKNINKLSDDNVLYLFKSVKDKQEIVKLIIQYKTELNDDNVYNLLYYADDKQEIADLLGSENISKLDDESVVNLLNYADDKKEMAKLIIQYKTDLSDDNVYNLLYYADDQQEIADILGSENISKLSDNSVVNLLNYADDKKKMAKLIIQYKTDLSDENVFHLLYFASDKQEIADLLGSKNINKLSDENVMDLLAYADDKQEIAEIILRYHKNLSDETKAKLEAKLEAEKG